MKGNNVKKVLFATMLTAAAIGGAAAIGSADRTPSVAPARPTQEQVNDLHARTEGAGLDALKAMYTEGLELARTCTEDAAAEILKARSIDVTVNSSDVEWTGDGFLGAFGLTSSDLDLSEIDMAEGQAALDEIGSAQERCIQVHVAQPEVDYQVRFKATESKMRASEDGFVRCVVDVADQRSKGPGADGLRSLARTLEERRPEADLRVALDDAMRDLSGRGVTEADGSAISAALADCGQTWAAPFYGPDTRGGK